MLAELLDDPYAAVRCIAERSLRASSPNLVPAGYDFALEPDQRASIRGAILERWSTGLPAQSASIPAETLVSPSGVAAMEQRFAELIAARNNRPVRLRE